MAPQQENCDDDESKHLVGLKHTKNGSSNHSNKNAYHTNNININQQKNEEGREPNPYPNASLFSKLFFTWPYPLLQKGMERPLEEHDLPHIMNEESSAYNRTYFETIWENELARVEEINHRNQVQGRKQQIRPNLHRALFIDFFKSTWIIQPMMFCASAARIVMSIALGNMTQAFVDKNGQDAYIWAATIVFCNLVVLLEHHHVFYITSRKGMNLRTGSVAAIFAKTLRLSSIGSSTCTGLDGKMSTISSGQIMNLVSNDVERYWITSLFISYIIWAPLQTIVILVLGLWLIGPAFAIGMGVLIFIFVPLQTYLSKHFAIVRSKVCSTTHKCHNYH